MVKRAPFVALLVVVVGCASILDIPDLEAPGSASPSEGGVDSALAPAPDAAPEAACPGPGVATLTRAPRSVHTALDTTDVYFTRVDPPRDSALFRCSKCGCAKPTPLATGLNQPGAVAVDDRYVFWTDSHENGSLNRMDKKDPSKRQELGGQDSPFGVTTDETYVYWTVVGGGAQLLETAGVYRAKKDDFSEVTRLAKAELLPDDIIPYAIVVDSSYVYYTTAPDLDTNTAMPCLDNKGTVRRLLKTGGLQVGTVLATDQACPVGLALAQDTLYWANLGEGKTLNGSIWRRPLGDAGAPTMIAANLGRPTSLSFHGGRLAWNVPASQRVEWCTAPACTDVTTLSNEQYNPSGLSADGSGIYWAVLGSADQVFADGALRRALLP